jgi:hypothetical protein
MSGPLKMLLGVMGTGCVTFVGLCAFAGVEVNASKTPDGHLPAAAAAIALPSGAPPVGTPGSGTPGKMMYLR